MKKLLAVVAIAAAALVPSALPADAATGHPTAGTPLLCTLHYTESATRHIQTSTVSGTCTGLPTLLQWTVTSRPWGGGGGDGADCPLGGPLSMIIGDAWFPVQWHRTNVLNTAASLLGLGGLAAPHPEVSVGAVTDGQGDTVGVGTFVGNVAECGLGTDRWASDGTLVITMTVDEPTPT